MPCRTAKGSTGLPQTVGLISIIEKAQEEHSEAEDGSEQDYTPYAPVIFQCYLSTE